MVYKFSEILFITLIILLTSYIFFSCAAEGMPPGGPKDETAPAIIFTFPENGKLNVDNDIDILFEFSEPVDYKSVENSLTVFPTLENKPKIKINKNKVRIKLNEDLQKNTTYIFSFGRKVKDYQKNITADEIKIAFSTGETIDRSTVSGKIYDYKEDKKTAYVLFYKNDDKLLDSLIFQSPTYFTSVDKHGFYKATNIAQGTYTLLTYIGSFLDKPRFTEEDMLAVATQNFIQVKSISDTITNIDMRLGKYPLRPFEYLKAIDEEGQLELTFSHEINEDIFPAIYVNGNGVSDLAYFPKDKQDVINLNFATKDSAEYILNISGVQDVFDRKMQPIMDTVLWKNKEVIDTLGSRVKLAEPGTKDVSINSAIKIEFTEPVQKVDDFKERLNFLDEDSNGVKFDTKYLNLTTYKIRPDIALDYAEKYKIAFLADSIMDFYGNNSQDSIKTFQFTTIDENVFGMISGTVTSELPLENIVLECHHVDKKEVKYRTSVTADGKYYFEQVIPGEYRLNLYLDENKNGKFDWGSIIPYQSSEKYKSFSTTVKVRSRWETERVELKF